MRLAICEPYDEPCLWAVVGLRRLGVELEVVLPRELIAGGSFSQHIDVHGSSFRIRLTDGRELSTDDVQGVLNRLLEVPGSWLERFRGPDREYVAEELQALLAGWLFAVPGPVLNRPNPATLFGEWRAVAEWRCLAGLAGLATVPYRLSTREEPGPLPPDELRTALVIGRDVVPAGTPVPGEVAAGCLALAGAAGTPLLGLDFALAPDGRWLFDAATPLPDLRRGGSAALEALRRALGA